jgi:hypothetical protein
MILFDGMLFHVFASLLFVSNRADCPKTPKSVPGNVPSSRLFAEHDSVRETRQFADTPFNDPIRGIGVGILARADSRETPSR